ncbi:ATP-binding protein [Streptomyces sp. NBC_01481]|uniref:ATP-binding protein n=1 Tax=Streptomyces sp. NBC_01481 TaxID=2975869 RepID=UPI00225450E6|nr:ATP-binding protein [Streptomyces sp. NBC_01481]MCX4584702.1 ATP-binding protein [Streptomyces sp. NBC_01481]
MALDADQRDAVKLVASELISNAVVHASGFIAVGLRLGEGRLHLVVHDSNPKPPERRYATEDDEGGRGLTLVDLLTSNHGWAPTARGKKTWAEFEVPAPAPIPVGTRLRPRIDLIISRAGLRLAPDPVHFLGQVEERDRAALSPSVTAPIERGTT